MPIHKNPLPALAILKERFAYDPATGVLTHRTHRCAELVGEEAGWPSGSFKEYLNVSLNCGGVRKQYAVHRIAWMFITGNDPGDMEVDHINGDARDNRANNLRLVTRTQNMQNQKHHRNNRLRSRGVHQKPNGRYAAAISCDGRRYHLGNYATIEEANIAYRAAAVVAHGKYKRVE
jgi:hypothetical protein